MAFFESFPIFDLLIAIGTIGTLIVLGITLYFQIQDRKAKIERFEKFPENDIWEIRILHPDKSIQRCSVSFDGKLLNSSKHGDSNEHTIEIMGGDNFIITEKIPREDGYVTVKSGQKTIIKKKFKDIESAKP